jgi:hypothetical protein
LEALTVNQVKSFKVLADGKDVFIGTKTGLAKMCADEFTKIDFNPRPEHLRNAPAYQDDFRNTCRSFPGISEMPIFQTFAPANTLAVALLHSYYIYNFS